jgi:hypothetical protein
MNHGWHGCARRGNRGDSGLGKASRHCVFCAVECHVSVTSRAVGLLTTELTEDLARAYGGNQNE